jgi:GTP-binding protein
MPSEIVSARFLGGAPLAQALPPPVSIEVAFAGRSNVGKSSLLNTLVSQHRLARTSSTPGCTRQISLFEARARDGLVLHLVDLPGYGYAERAKAERARWGPLVEDYLALRPTLGCLVLLFDARRGLEAEEHELVDFVRRRSHPSRPRVAIVLVATKLDKVPASRQKSRLLALQKEAAEPVIGFSLRHRAAVPELWGAIRRALGLAQAAVSEPSPEPPRGRARVRNRRRD